MHSGDKCYAQSLLLLFTLFHPQFSTFLDHILKSIDLHANLTSQFDSAHKITYSLIQYSFSTLTTLISIFQELLVTGIALRSIIPYTALMASDTCIRLIISLQILYESRPPSNFGGHTVSQLRSLCTPQLETFVINNSAFPPLFVSIILNLSK